MPPSGIESIQNEANEEGRAGGRLCAAVWSSQCVLYLQVAHAGNQCASVNEGVE